MSLPDHIIARKLALYDRMLKDENARHATVLLECMRLRESAVRQCAHSNVTVEPVVEGVLSYNAGRRICDLCGTEVEVSNGPSK